MKKKYTYDYPAHYVTVDPVVLGVEFKEKSCVLKTLLVTRGEERQPFHGEWALAGTFVRPEESCEQAVLRKLEEATSISQAVLQQLHTYSDPKRDPRGRVLTVGYTALVDYAAIQVRAGGDADRAEWFQLDQLPKLAFDHADIVARALEWLRARIRYEPIVFGLLPPVFTVKRMHQVCESVLGFELNMPNFRRSVARMPIFREVGEEEDVSHRPAKLVSFDPRAYERWVKKGNAFQV
jgi:8-oxo-dGTP diphosphatase